MSQAKAYGIDFGTTNSAISVAWEGGSVSVIEINATSLIADVLPSLAYVDRSSVSLAGAPAVNRFLVTGPLRTQCDRCDLVDRTVAGVTESACRQYRAGSGCQDSRLISGLKGELSDPHITHTHSWAIDRTWAELIAIVLSRLKSIADERTGVDVRRVVLGHPAVFAGAEGPDFQARQDLAKERLVEAGHAAGFQSVKLFPEPAAVVLDEVADDGVVVAVDFGGGTFDCAVMRLDNDVASLVGLQGIAIGGEDFDRLLFEHFVAEEIGLNSKTTDGRRIFPAWFRRRLATLGGAKHLLSNPETYMILEDLGDRSFGAIKEILHGGQAYNFYRAVEMAKIELSVTGQAQIRVTRRGLDVAIDIDRRSFEELIAPRLDQVFDRLDAALEQAEVSRDEVRLVFRTGGSSEIPAFISRLRVALPNAELRALPVFTAVAHGMGVFAQEVWPDGR